MARAKPVVAVLVSGVELFASHAHTVGVVVEQHEGDRKLYSTAVCISMPCMNNAPSPAMTTVRRSSGERAADACAEAVTHTAHPSAMMNLPVGSHRQQMDRCRSGVACVHDDVCVVGQRVVEHGHRVAIAHAGADVRRWCQLLTCGLRGCRARRSTRRAARRRVVRAPCAGPGHGHVCSGQRGRRSDRQRRHSTQGGIQAGPRSQR